MEVTATKAQAEKMMALFEGRMDAHGTHGEPQRKGLKWEIKTTARTLREPVTVEIWMKHLEGKRPLGVVSINENAMCHWGSIDFDEYDDIDVVALIRAAERWPLVPCRSKSGGLHFFLFTSEPVPAGDMLATLRAVAASMGMAGSEIFPKQSNVLTDRGDIGNWMVMPYFGGTFDGKLKNQFGLKKTGAEMTLNEFISAAQSKRLTAKQFETLAKSTRTGKVAAVTTGKSPKGKKDGTSAPGDFGDGPPCLQHMSSGGFPEGARNNSLFMVGLYLKRAFPSDWRKKLEEDNQRFMKPPLTADEVTQVRKQLEKKEYEYTCKVEPMASHCDAGLCRTRKHGVGETGEYPNISSMSKMNSDPAIWFVTVGEKRIELGTNDLISYQRFQAVVAEQHGIFFSSMKQSDWIKVLSDASGTLEQLDPPPETTKEYKLHQYLEDFLTNRARGSRLDDIWMKRPVLIEEENTYYFRLKDFEAYLRRENVKDYASGWISNYIIKKLDGGRKFFNRKDKGVNTYWVSADKIQTTPDVEPEKLTEEEV